jgi:hypothetical protein
MAFSLLLGLGDKIAKSSWDPLAKQAVWAAATTKFFASTRLGEILASEEVYIFIYLSRALLAKEIFT